MREEKCMVRGIRSAVMRAILWRIRRQRGREVSIMITWGEVERDNAVNACYQLSR